MKQIPLTQGQVALVDDEDFDWLNSFKWFAVKTRNTFYAKRNIRVNGKQRTQQMHILIMGTHPTLKCIDHVKGNGLDNQKYMLRFCTRQENNRNVMSRKNNSSVYKGVHWHKKNKKWTAHIGINGKTIYLGSFDNEIDAAATYDKAAIKYFGEFAYLNFKSITIK